MNHCDVDALQALFSMQPHCYCVTSFGDYAAVHVLSRTRSAIKRLLPFDKFYFNPLKTAVTLIDDETKISWHVAVVIDRYQDSNWV